MTNKADHNCIQQLLGSGFAIVITRSYQFSLTSRVDVMSGRWVLNQAVGPLERGRTLVDILLWCCFNCTSTERFACVNQMTYVRDRCKEIGPFMSRRVESPSALDWPPFNWKCTLRTSKGDYLYLEIYLLILMAYLYKGIFSLINYLFFQIIIN